MFADLIWALQEHVHHGIVACSSFPTYAFVQPGRRIGLQIRGREVRSGTLTLGRPNPWPSAYSQLNCIKALNLRPQRGSLRG